MSHFGIVSLVSRSFATIVSMMSHLIVCQSTTICKSASSHSVRFSRRNLDCHHEKQQKQQQQQQQQQKFLTMFIITHFERHDEWR